MGHCRFFSHAGVIAVLLGCAGEPAPGPSSDSAGQSVLYPCDRVDEKSLAPDEVTPLGFAPNDVLSFVFGSQPLRMRWWSPWFRADGGVWEATPGETSDVQVDVEPIGAARWVDREPTPLGGDCPDLVAFLRVESAITPAGGAFARFTIRGLRAPGCTGSPDGLSCPGPLPADSSEVMLGEVRIVSE